MNSTWSLRKGTYAALELNDFNFQCLRMEPSSLTEYRGAPLHQETAAYFDGSPGIPQLGIFSKMRECENSSEISETLEYRKNDDDTSKSLGERRSLITSTSIRRSLGSGLVTEYLRGPSARTHIQLHLYLSSSLALRKPI